MESTDNLSPCSVELGRSAAGKTTITVKTYAATADLAYESAKAVFEKAKSENPM